MRKGNAAIAAGYSQAYALKGGKRVGGLSRTKFGKVGFIEWLDRAGITDKELSDHAQEGLTAVKANGHPDWQARANYFKNLLMIFGHLKGEESGQINNINIKVVRYDGASVQSPRLAISNLLGQN